jgi:hypothetical protein
MRAMPAQLDTAIQECGAGNVPELQKSILGPPTSEQEEWRKLSDWNYEVSSWGHVRHANTKKLLKPAKTPNGYLRVILTTKRKDFRVHRLVAEAFCRKPPSDQELFVNHIDGDKLNPRWDNLEWVTPSQNSLHAVRLGLFRPGMNAKRKIGENVVVEIRQRMASGETGEALAAEYGVSSSLIYRIANGQRRAGAGGQLRPARYAKRYSKLVLV